MKNLIAILTLSILPMILFCTTHTVSLDGTGDFNVIQQAINSSVNGDTVLVYPGYYVENLNFNGRSIKLYSLEALTGEDHYIAETTINGAGVYRVIEIIGHVLVDAEIRGFSITNGYGDEDGDIGAGICVGGSGNIKITNCDIFENRTIEEGGGVFISFDIIAEFAGVKIHDNYGLSGGGLYCNPSEAGELIFSSVNRCSIYNNYSTFGMDICLDALPPGYDEVTMIYLDMFSVISPDPYYANYRHSVSSGTINPMQFDILRGYSTPVNADLYVSMNGDDNNSGLTPDDPKYSIVEACRLIASDSLNPKTIYLEAGDYSPQFTDLFCIPALKQYCRLRGDSSETTILRGSLRDKTLLDIAWGGIDIEISGITIENTQGGVSFGTNDGTSLKMDDVIIKNCHRNTTAGLFIQNTDNIKIRNSKFISNASVQSASGVFIIGKVNCTGHVLIENCEFIDNVSVGEPVDNLDNSLRIGGDTLIVRNCIFRGNIDSGHANSNAFTLSGNSLSLFENNLVVDNHSQAGSAVGYVAAYTGKAIIRNNTFVNNTVSWQQDLTHFAVNGRDVEIYNNIYRNPGSMYPSDELLVLFGDSTDVFSMHNNLFRGGEQNISASPERFEYMLVYGENNIDVDPGFTGGDSTSADYYKLQETSPCVDAGAVTGSNFPLLDLAGHSRIYGSTVDMGCYEWQPVGNFNQDLDFRDTKIIAYNYPNPFNPTTTIEYSLPEEGNVCIEVYNIKGQKVKQLINEHKESGHHTIKWNGTDENNKSVGSGVYFYKVKTEKSSLINKMIMLK